LSATRILGIDPGSRVTGYGLIDAGRTRTRYVASGCIRASGTELTQRLAAIYDGIQQVVREFSPGQIAIERVFVHRNADSALKLGHARSAALCATFASGAEVFEYAARQVKQSVVGSGGADKAQVQHMVRALLSIDGAPAPDEADALAVALCHAHSQPLVQLLGSAAR